MLTIHKRLNERSENKSKMAEDNNAEAIFVKMVANELQCLPKKLKIMLKHEIDQSIF